jgi:hypothetical protein
MAQLERKLTVEELIAKNICPVKAECVKPYRSKQVQSEEAAAVSDHVSTLKQSRKRLREVCRFRAKYTWKLAHLQSLKAALLELVHLPLLSLLIYR